MANIGDFGVVPMRGYGATLIRIGQWLNGDGFADFEHAFLYVGDNQIVEAQPDGARLGSLDEYQYSRIAWYTAPPISGNEIATQGRKLVGTPYSWADYFALAAVRFGLPMASRVLRHYVASSKSMICSQLVDYAYEQAGVQLFDDHRAPGDVTPGDLYNLIVSQQSRGQ
jgi:cell wall-associated NlpC family hydrolase